MAWGGLLAAAGSGFHRRAHHGEHRHRRQLGQRHLHRLQGYQSQDQAREDPVEHGNVHSGRPCRNGEEFFVGLVTRTRAKDGGDDRTRQRENLNSLNVVSCVLLDPEETKLTQSWPRTTECFSSDTTCAGKQCCLKQLFFSIGFHFLLHLFFLSDVRHERYFQVAVCSGCDVYRPWAAMVVGVIGGFCLLGTQWAVLRVGVDDPLDATAGSDTSFWHMSSVSVERHENVAILQGAKLMKSSCSSWGGGLLLLAN